MASFSSSSSLVLLVEAVSSGFERRATRGGVAMGDLVDEVGVVRRPRGGFLGSGGVILLGGRLGGSRLMGMASL